MSKILDIKYRKWKLFTVWMKVGGILVRMYRSLKPLNIALVAGILSESA